MGKRGLQRFATNDWEVNYKNTGNLATRTINFIQALPTTDGNPAKLMGWQQRFIRDLLKVNKGKRQIRNALLSCGRKNGKTGLASYLMLAHLFCALQKRGTRLYSVANDRAQASLVFDELEGIILQCPTLLQEVNIIRYHKIIEHQTLGIKYQAMSSDSHRLQGLRPYFAIFDELGVAKNRSTFDAMVTAFGAMKEGLLLTMSTQAADDHHIMSELYDHAVKVRDGIIKDAAFLPAIYSAPMDADIYDQASWKAANPSLGTIRNLDELKQQALRVKEIQSNEPAFRNLILNQRVAANAREVWIDNDTWMKCYNEFTPTTLHGERCVLGLDMSSVLDLTALCAYFPDTHHILMWTWTPRQTADKLSNIPYRVWEQMGLLTVTEGNAINQIDVLRHIAKLHADYDVQCLGYDRWRLERLAADLETIGLETNLKEVGLGYKSMSPAVSELEELIISKKLKHQGSPLMSWQMNNVILDTDASGNRKPNKTKAVDKIDCVVALLIAIFTELDSESFELPTLTAL